MSKQCIGIDLGGTFIKFGLLDENNTPSETFQLPTPSEGGEAVAEQMAAGAKQLMEKHSLSRNDIVGVGIGSPGPLDINNGVILALPNINGMNNMPIRDMVCKELGVPGVLENDANAAAYGEFLCGAGKGAQDMVLLTLGTGIGSGIVVDGKLIHGAHGIAAELGHLIVQAGGEKCGCGQKGCLERYASATFLARYGQRLLEQGRESCLQAVLKEKGEINARDVQEAAFDCNDALAKEVWDRGMYYLAVGCVNICRIFDPDEIVLVGGLIKAGDRLMGPLQEHFQREHWTLAEPKTKIVFSILGNDAGVIGAAGAAWAAHGNRT